jgi:hypothetical protein
MCIAYGSAIKRSVSLTILFGKAAIVGTALHTPARRRGCFFGGDAQDEVPKLFSQEACGATNKDPVVLADFVVFSARQGRTVQEICFGGPQAASKEKKRLGFSV